MLPARHDPIPAGPAKFPPMLKRLLRSERTQEALAWLVVLYLNLALRSIRWRVVAAEGVAPILAGAPAVVALWHEFLPVMPALWFRLRREGRTARVHVLVSRHRDGRFIGRVLARLGVGVVHGSSTRGGAAAGRTLSELLAGGETIILTPDGPRGPRRAAAPGVAWFAAISGVPVLPAAALCRPRLVLKSWDRMVIPLPFGRGAIVLGEPIAVAEEEGEQALPAISAALDRAGADAARILG